MVRCTPKKDSLQHLEEPGLFINSIYLSVQGESTRAGEPCVFVRTSGCPLRCRWCDTPYAFESGERLTLSNIIRQVEEFAVPLVELTGGEPLAQSQSSLLCQQLLDRGFQVMIETGGSEDIGTLPPETHIIMDLKCPGSGMESHNRWDNLEVLKTSDELKFVLAHHEDFLWAQSIIEQHGLIGRCQLLFSPAFGLLKPRDLVQWILETRLPVRLNLQLHKYIWHPSTPNV